MVLVRSWTSSIDPLHWMQGVLYNEWEEECIWCSGSEVVVTAETREACFNGSPALPFPGSQTRCTLIGFLIGSTLAFWTMYKLLLLPLDLQTFSLVSSWELGR